MKFLHKRYRKELNGKTPAWFRDWYAAEFVPYKVKLDILIVLATGIFIGIVANFIA